MTDAQRRSNLIAIPSARSASALGMGLTLPRLSLILERRGIPGSVNGLDLATAGLAAVFVTPQVPRLMVVLALISASYVLSLLLRRPLPSASPA